MALAPSSSETMCGQQKPGQTHHIPEKAMTEDNRNSGGKKSAIADREKRLAQALRANLKRRKDQLRERRSSKAMDVKKAD